MSTPYASSKEGFGRALDLARSGQATPSTPSGGGSPAPQVSSRGRLIRPVKRVEPATLPSRAAPPAAFTPRMASSSLNPHRAPPPPAAKTPLSPFPDPMPPLSAIADPRYQALYTTFPSRMRLGTSSLMQPNYNALVGGASGSTTPAGQPYRRPRAVVNYAEIEGLEDSEDESNDVDPNGKSGRRGTPGMGTPKPSASGAPLSAREQWGEVKSYLGTLPPGNLVMVQRANRTKHGHFTDEQLEDQAEEQPVLVPIQLELDVDTFKIRDSFVWNIREKLITPEAFARILCDDLDIAPGRWVTEIARQIKEQCEEQAIVAEIPVRDEQEARDDVEKDLRVVLNLDVQIGTIHLVDRVEWDLSSPLTPELFTSILVKDLGLSSSATPLIAHAIHEELYRHKRNCLETGLVGAVGYEHTGPTFHGNKKFRGARQLEGVWREWAETVSFGPRIEILSLDEMDRLEAERDANNKRLKQEKMMGPSRTGGRRR